jgi:maltooligosyltrehalose trehalohydrolase
MKDPQKLGAIYQADGRCHFLVWAPYAERVSLQCDGRAAVPMQATSGGYYRLQLEDVHPGARYLYLLNGETARPDPASRYQPEGVHGPSAVIDSSFPWTDDAWSNPALEQYVFYELHCGTFSTAGTLDGIVPSLPYLRDVGITAIEIMPVAQFPGDRNWGYDGVFPFAVQNSYGGPTALKRLVNAAHGEGLAVVLDVVYNHLGPEGNYLRDYGPYFTDRYRTPWGEALNFDGPDSGEVRRFFIGNALQWVTDFHIDALRLDAIHAIFDTSARPFLQELASAVHDCGAYVIAESDSNDVRVMQPRESGGLGCDAVWSDSFHHSLHSLITGEREGYYRDFGSLADLAKAYTEGFVYSGQYSQFRRRRHGNSARGLPGKQFVVCMQNHDQIGNRALGERLSTLVDLESLKLAAGAVLFSANLPLLFMGEEYGETAPFLYFTSHGDPELTEAVRRGRKEEFAEFSWQGEVPDPQDPQTFRQSRLTPEESRSPEQQMLCEFHRQLLRIRKQTPALSHLDMESCEAIPLGEEILLVRRWCNAGEVVLLFCFSHSPAEVQLSVGRWTKLIASSDRCWSGPGDMPAVMTSSGESRITLAPRSFALYVLSE